MVDGIVKNYSKILELLKICISKISNDFLVRIIFKDSL